MKYFLVLLLSGLMSNLMAAELNDRIYLSARESIPCKLLLKSDAANALSIVYKDKNNVKQRKNAGEIWGFQTSSGDLYQSKRLNIDGKERNYFAQIITQGHAALFVVYSKESGEHRFLEKNGDDPVRIKSGMETNILTYLFLDCPAMNQEYIESKDPENISKLANLVVEYSDCVNAEVENSISTDFESSRVKLRPGLFVGANFFTLKEDNSNADKENVTNFLIGANLEIEFGRSLSLVPGLEYSNARIQSVRPLPLYPHMTLITEYASKFRSDLAFRWVMGYKKIRPYVSLAPCFTLGNTTISRDIIGSDGQTLQSEQINYFTVGGRAAVGAKFSTNHVCPFMEIRYSIEQVQSKPGPKSEEDYILNTAQIVLGVAF